MKIVLVGQGSLPIPPKGWGAVEQIIWEYAVRLRARGHTVHIVNSKWRLAALQCAFLARFRKVDVIHVHQVRVLRWLTKLVGTKTLVVATCHEPVDIELDEQTLGDMTQCKHHMVLHDAVGRLVKARRPGVEVARLRNGTNVGAFATHIYGNERAVCVGKIQSRKRQRELAQVLLQADILCDFVGPIGDEELPEGASWLGEWDRETLHAKLGEYSTLVLVSHAEGQPLVVAEGLAAGLSVVVSPDAAQNLDANQPFVTITNEPAAWAEAVQASITANAGLRDAARAYARTNLDLDEIVGGYVWQLATWRSNRQSALSSKAP